MAEMTPIERAVKAVEERLIGHVDPTSHAMSEYGIASMIVPIVLTAIREPSEAMVVDTLDHEALDGRTTSRHIWQAMIDAALAEEVT